MWNSVGSGSGLLFWQSSGSCLIGFANFSKVRVRVYRFLILNFGFSGLSGSGLNLSLSDYFRVPTGLIGFGFLAKFGFGFIGFHF